jgi:putative hydrolase of the HAD superfamily
LLRAVFFDAAGTLFEAREPIGQSYARLARSFGVEADDQAVDAAFRRAFRSAPGLAFGPGRSRSELRLLERRWWRERVAQTFDGLGDFADFDAYFSELFDFFANPARWRADPQAAMVVERLREMGLQVGLISNFDYRIYQILDGLGLRKRFDSITISSEAGWAKPAAEVFRVALDRHLLQPAQAIHVGDSEHLDVAGARAAGLTALLLRPDHGAEAPGCVSSLDAVVNVAQAMLKGER